MRSNLILSSLLALLSAAASVSLAQTPPQPGPEHIKMKEMEGTWDCVVKFGEGESKAVSVMKMDLNGLWLITEFAGDFGGMKFTGRGLDSYDPVKKKYVGVWVDSWVTSPMISEGTMDKDGTLTMLGEGPGEDGKPKKYRMVTQHKDKDNFVFTMSSPGADGKEATMMTITYKRRK